MIPRVCILKTDGTNCDQETAHAFEIAGGKAIFVTLNQLKTGAQQLHEFDILAIPGGFSYGDDIASGKLFALELEIFLKQQLYEFITQKKLIVGICNGFQVLVQLGLLPFNTISTKQASLIHNDSARFECRWVDMMIQKSSCIFTQDMHNVPIQLPVAHGEGKFYASQTILTQLEQQQLVVLRYTRHNTTTQEYPHNPSGTLNAIAGICDPTGRIFGLMPHPERFVQPYQHPNWRRNTIPPFGLPMFKSAINYVK